MRIFNRKETTEIKEAQIETEEVKKKSDRIERLSASLQEHLKDNHFGPRLYAQMLENWK